MPYTYPMEVLDIVDSSDNVLGAATKEVVRQKGLYSRVAFIILLNQQGELFLQQRKATKKTYPLYWSGSAAGHVKSGESYKEAAIRELEEELGIRTELNEVGKFVSEEDKEIVTVFIGRSEGPYMLEEDAIETAEYFSLDRLGDESPSMKRTSYLDKSVPMVSSYLST